MKSIDDLNCIFLKFSRWMAHLAGFLVLAGVSGLIVTDDNTLIIIDL